MTDTMGVDTQEVDTLYQGLLKDAEASGYYLNPDAEFAEELVKGLIANKKRYGYAACPCRLASGIKEEDLDIVCPCDYRDQDLSEHGTCYCALYVSRAVLKGDRQVTSIPERRPSIEKRVRKETRTSDETIHALPLPVWRCRACGYLCARQHPPDVCPICKAKQERFERFM